MFNARRGFTSMRGWQKLSRKVSEKGIGQSGAISPAVFSHCYYTFNDEEMTVKAIFFRIKHNRIASLYSMVSMGSILYQFSKANKSINYQEIFLYTLYQI